MRANGAAATEHARVGDHDIDAPEPLQRQAHGFLDRREVGDVALQRQTMARWEGRGNRLRRWKVDIRDHHPCPAVSQCRGGGRTQPATGPGDQDDLVGQ